MTRTVHIVAPADDPHAVVLSWALSRLGVATRISGNLAQWNDRPVAVEIAGDALRGIDALSATVWNRRPRAPQPPPMHAEDIAYAQTEWSSFHRNLEAAAIDLLPAFWVNPPTAARAAENKLTQLVAAREIGLSFPDTVIGNDAAAVRRLAQRCERIVFKTFRPHIWLDGERGKPLATAAVTLDAATLPDTETIALCPAIYQRYVEKAADIRITVAGSRKLAVAMRNRNGSAFLDWRVHSLDDDFLIESFAVPAALDRQIDALMAKLGLVFGCLDFVIDHRGDVQFLEINQAGQFLFVEELLPECGMLRLVASFLAAGACDYAVSADPHLTLARCLAETTVKPSARRP